MLFTKKHKQTFCHFKRQLKKKKKSTECLPIKNTSFLDYCKLITRKLSINSNKSLLLAHMFSKHKQSLLKFVTSWGRPRPAPARRHLMPWACDGEASPHAAPLPPQCCSEGRSSHPAGQTHGILHFEDISVHLCENFIVTDSILPLFSTLLCNKFGLSKFSLKFVASLHRARSRRAGLFS